jgi:hypothetical protein
MSQNTFVDHDDNSSDASSAEVPFMRLCCRPPQFYCASAPLTAGKTSTTITEMEKMIAWFLQEAGAANSTLITQFKRIVHLIFVNNSLIEGDQWAGRLVSRGIQKMRIFSSKSDINTADSLYGLIAEGQYDSTNDTYTPVDYVLQCTNGFRLSDYCEDKQTASGPKPSILKRMSHWRPDVGFVIWSDEIDKLADLWKSYVPKMREFGNVIQVNGITATPYAKYWDLVHTLGFGDIPLIGTLPDPSDYRTISDHKRIYTNSVNIKSPVKNFKYLLDHPGELCYTETAADGSVTEHRIPDLKTNTGAIYYAPGEVATRTHAGLRGASGTVNAPGIADIANQYGKNSLVINGKFKEYRYADGRPPATVADYKAAMIKAGTLYRDHSGELIPFSRVAYMDIARAMYNDPALGLKGTDLVITGFNCITRGITFNSPNFQFDYVILSDYHYKEGSKQIEEIIQAVGRSHGNTSWVKPGIIFLSPKYILDMVETKIKEMIQFLRTAPTEIKYADVFRETKAIPIKVVFSTREIVQELRQFGNLTAKKRIGFMNLLRKGLVDGSITLHDPNTVSATQARFCFDDYLIGTKRVLDDAAKAKNYRFQEFLSHHNLRIPYGQAVDTNGEFNIDITLIEQGADAARIEAGTGFISFMFKPATATTAAT